MIDELMSYRFWCDWESDNAGCGISIDVLSVGEDFGDAVKELAAKGWVLWPAAVDNDVHSEWVFCPDCKESSMAERTYAELLAVL